MKVYAESKIKPTKINATTVKMLKKQYPILDTIGFFSTKTTSTNDTIYVIDLGKVELVKGEYFYTVKIGSSILDGLKVYILSTAANILYNTVYKITSDHWKTPELKEKRTIVALDDKDFNIQIDAAVNTTKGVIDKLEYRIKKLKKIDWKV